MTAGKEKMWDIEELIELIGKLHGEEQAKNAKMSCESLLERRTYAHFHWHEYCRIFHGNFISTGESTNVLKFALSVEAQNPSDISNPLTQLSAHALGCLQSLHSIIDIFSHIVCYAAGLNAGVPPKLKDRSINMENVEKAIRGNENFSNAEKLLSAISSNPVIKHLSAIVNVSKHRRVLSPEFVADFRQVPVIYKIEFQEFFHKNISYPAIDAREMMEKSNSVLWPAIVNCGNEINKSLL